MFKRFHRSGAEEDSQHVERVTGRLRGLPSIPSRLDNTDPDEVRRRLQRANGGSEDRQEPLPRRAG